MTLTDQLTLLWLLLVLSMREVSAYADVVEGDILVDRGEAGGPGMLHAVVTTDTDRSTVKINTQRRDKSTIVHI